MELQNLGGELRRLRKKTGQNLSEASSSVGISVSFLSQIETGKVRPSVGTLLSLANLYGAPLDDLFDRQASGTQMEDPRNVKVGNIPLGDSLTPPRHEDSDKPVESEFIEGANALTIKLENGVSWRKLADGGGKHATSLLVTYDPGASDTSDGSLKRHESLEFGYIIEGTLELQLEFKTQILNEGDSFYFNSRKPHLFTNTSTSPARGVWFLVE